MLKKAFLSILLLFLCFSPNFQKTLAFYVSEGAAFYARSSSAGYAFEGVAFYAFENQLNDKTPVYRYYSPTSNDHFFTLENNSFPGYNPEGIAFHAYGSQVAETYPVYRFYNSITGNHFYTASAEEKELLIANSHWGHIYEGIAFYAPKNQIQHSKPIYRLYNFSTDDHLYTLSEEEKNYASSVPIYRYYNPTSGDHFYFNANRDFSRDGYVPEGTAFYAEGPSISSSSPIYRYYNPTSGDHFYTTEKTDFNGYIFEGIAFYARESQISGTFPVYRFYNYANSDHFYTISENEKRFLEQSELGPEISVGLWNYSVSSLKDSPFKITADKDYVIKNEVGEIIASVSANKETRVSYDKNSYFKVYGSIAENKVKKVVYFEATDDDNNSIVFDANRPDSSYDQYRGKIAIRYTDDSNIWVINTLPLEHYVWGMGETTGTGPDEHTKVMTVIFRTYGKWYIDYATKYAKYGFKIRSDSGSQIYNGYDWETKYPNIKKNAKQTRGVAAVYNNQTALTPYSSWSDGKTRCFPKIWGDYDSGCSSDYPWCKSVSDSYGKHPSKNTQTLVNEGNHMVGLVANGSLKLASDHGWDYQRIMKYYYSGIYLNPVY